MNRTRFVLGLFLMLAVTLPSLRAQDKPKPDAKVPYATLKAQITITENEGEKKVVSLPYTFFLKAGGLGESWSTATWAKLRMGSRVPVYVGKDNGMQYIDVGTNIDSRALPVDESRFDVFVNLERSWVEGDVLVPVERASSGAPEAHSTQFREPVIRQFKTELTLTMRDGQTIQSTLATDPLSGKVLAITVNLTVVK